MSAPTRRTDLKPHRSITVRLVLLVVGCAGALTLALAFVAGEILHAQIEERTGPQFEHFAKQIAERMERDVLGRLREVQLLASRAELWSSGARNEDQRRALDELQALSNLAWIGFMDPHGKVSVAAEGVLEGVNVGGERWFRAGASKAFVSGVGEVPKVAATTGGGRFITIAAPVTNAAGNVTGLLVAHLYWMYDIQTFPLPLTAAREQIVASIFSPEGWWLLSTARASGVRDHPAAFTRRDRRGHGDVNIDGRAYVEGFVRHLASPEFPALNWIVAVRQPAEETFAPVRRLRVRIVRWGLGCAILCAIPAYRMGKKLSRRLTAMAISAERVQSGEVTAELPIFPAGDELGRMSRALSEMVDELRRAAVRAEVVAPVPAAPAEKAVEERSAKPTGADPRRVVW